MVHEDLTPDRILTREAFENAIVVNSAIGGSTNCPPHINAIARHIGVDLDRQRLGDASATTSRCWRTCSPRASSLGEGFHRAGGVPRHLRRADPRGQDPLRCASRSPARPSAKTAPNRAACDPEIIRPYDLPLKENAGFLVVSGNLFDSALVKTSVISENFRRRFLSTPGNEDCFVARVIVFDGPEDYRAPHQRSLARDRRMLACWWSAAPVRSPIPARPKWSI